MRPSTFPVPAPSPLPAAPGYPFALDAGTELSRARRVLADALASRGRDGSPTRSLRDAIALGRCRLAHIRRGDAWGGDDDMWDGVPSTPESIEGVLARLDLLASDLAAERPGTAPVVVADLDAEVSRRFAEANAALRRGDQRAIDALDALALALCRACGMPLPDLARVHDLGEARTAHLLRTADLTYRAVPMRLAASMAHAVRAAFAPARDAVPLGTVAHALASLEALINREAVRVSRRLS
jgi:hypothetical protein